MTPDLSPIILSLVDYMHDLQKAHKVDDRSAFYSALSNIERLANYHKTKMSQRMVIDPTDVDDEDL